MDEWRANKYMVKTPDVIHSYAERMGKRIEFARAFDGKTFDDILSEIETAMRKTGANDKRIAEVKSGFVAEHDRLMGALLRNLTALTISYLSSARLMLAGRSWAEQVSQLLQMLALLLWRMA